ncbi:MAG: ATP-dependent sacrificial sulfur transferase LarE [Oscillospiraceae bacterium]|nr:ATP-dependent sacrificial sulfur transferase LarE [Oscillospiraceae bacterium]
MELAAFFKENPRAALAFSGGVDSAYLLYFAANALCDITAYYVKTEFQPAFEYEDALRLANELGVKMKTIELSVLSDENITSNDKDRCYHCKKKIFSAISNAAKMDGYDLLIDGSNASDDAADRPGMRATAELKVRSPLRECGLTKSDIRALSKEAGLFTWDKPAYACLATRVTTFEEITKEKLEITEKAEEYLKSLGFSDFRIRLFNQAARIQLPEKQLGLLLEKRQDIIEGLGQDYKAVLLDLEVR